MRRTRKAVTAVAIVACVAAAALSSAEAAAPATGWQLVAKACDRNSRTPDATILSEDVSYGYRHKLVTQATRGGNKLEWKVTCYSHGYLPATVSATKTARGRFWPGRGRREYLLPSFENLVPSWAKGRLVKYPNGWVEWVPPDATVDCYASVYFDAPWGRARTLGVWLLERDES
jgi:hypothetical protein